MTASAQQGKPATGGRYWPDRKAYLHRKRAHRLFYVLAILAAAAPWFGYRYVRDAVRGDDPASAVPPRAEPFADAPRATGAAIPVRGGPDAVSTEHRMGVIRAATAAGDDEAMHAGVDAMNAASRQAMRLADPERAVVREAARVAVQRLPGVRAAGWMDRTRLLVVSAHGVAGSEAMVDAVCRQLQPLGDTVGMVVSVQDFAADGRSPRETSRRCGAAPDDASEPTSTTSTSRAGGTGVAGAFPAHGEARPAPEGSPDARNPAAQDPDPRDPRDPGVRNEESMRILEETTPEM